MTPTVEARPETLRPPAAPVTLEETGLSLDLIVQLAVKTLHFAGELSGVELGHRLGLTFPAVEPALDTLIGQHQCEIVVDSDVTAQIECVMTPRRNRIMNRDNVYGTPRLPSRQMGVRSNGAEA